MNESINLWQVLAGVAVFMLGMRFLEESLQSLAGRSFKLFLKKNTANRFRAVAGGSAITAVLQSSSVVNLLVLAFVGASLLTMQNALAVILGANFGTTISNWVIATVGFSFQISDFAYPLTGVAGIALAISKTGTRFYNWSKFFLGFSFIFLGLAFIRTGIEEVIVTFNFSGFANKSSFIHLLAGFIITSLIQSSSATMAIILSLLHAKGIDLQTAMVITLGSEVGTTVKVVLASLGSNAVKKQVAAGNLFFNVIVVAIIFVFLSPVHYLFTEIIAIRNPLISLVAFQSFINLACIVLFLPVLPKISTYLQKIFIHEDDHAFYISKVSPSVPDIALGALENEARRFLKLELYFTIKSFSLDRKLDDMPPDSKEFADEEISKQYEYLKTLHGKIHAFNSGLLQHNLNESESHTLEKLIGCVRNTMYAAKSIHDAKSDIHQLKNSSKDEKYNHYQAVRDKVIEFCEKVNGLMVHPDPYEELLNLYRSTVDDYEQSLHNLYNGSLSLNLDTIEVSTLLNFNREMVSAFKSVLFAMKDLVLDEGRGDEFEALPGFIR